MKPLDLPLRETGAVVSLDAGDAVAPARYGARAVRLARLIALGIPVPPGAALSFDCVRALAEGGPVPDLGDLLRPGRLLVLRSSPAEPGWGGPPAIRMIGLNDAALPALAERVGRAAALRRYLRFVRGYGVAVAGLDAEPFEALEREAARAATDPERVIERAKALYAEEAEAEFPCDPAAQLDAALRCMARAWNAPSARMLREANGAPADAGLGLIVQDEVLCRGAGGLGTGIAQAVDRLTGGPGLSGQFQMAGDAPETVDGLYPPVALTAPDGPDGEAVSLESVCPGAPERLRAFAERAAEGLGDAVQLEFALEAGEVSIIDAVPARRNARAAVRIAVDLAERGTISREEALLRIEPRALIAHLHPQIDPGARRDVIATGLAASPGAATGRIVFSAEAALSAAAQDEATILVRAETSAEDIRGMHAARGVLTARGGMTSHAAVIARGLGLPCVVGASGLRLDPAARTLATADGRVLHEGAVLTVDGTTGDIIAGAPRTIAPELGGALAVLLEWADAARDLGVRANADTPAEARVAREFGVDGLGLCRTEHMFFEIERIEVMREMILADSAEERRAALERLLPMQRADFEELFEIMRGLPVTIRLLDPPLHEFLPSGEEELRHLAEATGVPVAQAKARAAELAEFNPMLGMRGVRLGVVMPEIYEMQARAIFEAALAVNHDAAAPVVPEVMIPLVSAWREVELVKARVDAVARAVAAERGARPEFRLGVMVETPRAALRSGDLAASSAFLSFGTNDLTQMTYGLSRDDAGRFMRDYVQKGVFPEDPFHSLDVEGVGELLLIAARRGRARNPDLVLGLCGEHGGDPASIQFCKLAGFDYVSCSPYRVPIARLAAAQATILVARGAAHAAAER
jgi:pyruvate, orthophosphate dikinase